MSLAAAIDRAVRCLCCGAAVGECKCWDDDGPYDRCGAEFGFGCVLHCHCDECTTCRVAGLHRVYIVTGTRHFAFKGDAVCLCGQKIPDSKWVAWYPANRIRGSECKRCIAALQRMAATSAAPSTPAAPPPAARRRR